MNGISSEIFDKKPCKIKIKVGIEKDLIEQKREETFVRIQKTAKLSGFRKGKVPMNVVKSQFQDTARVETMKQILPEAVDDIIVKEKLSPLVYPEISKLDFKDDGSVTFEMDVEINPEFEVKGYKGIKIGKVNINVSQDEVDEHINKLRDERGILEEDKEGVAKEDSFVVIDYEGSIAGQVFDGGSQEDATFCIKDSNFIPGFAEGIVGMQKGEEKDVKCKFPENYGKEDFAGKEAVFNIKLKEVKKKILANLDEDFLKEFGAENLEDFKKDTEEKLKKQKDEQGKKKTEEKIVKSLLEINKIEVPDSIVESEIDTMIERIKQYYGMYGAGNFDQEVPRDTYRKDAEDKVKISYILHAICYKENILVTEEDFLEKQNNAISEAKKENEKNHIKKYFKENKEYIKANIKQEKLFKFLVDNAKSKG
ncbi:trigger factor [bacterium]